MTASDKEREDKLCDRRGYVEDQEIKLENKRRTIEPAGALEAKRERNPGEKDGLKGLKTASFVFDKSALMDKSNSRRIRVQGTRRLSWRQLLS